LSVGPASALSVLENLAAAGATPAGCEETKEAEKIV
jgi:hypothetical protein